MELSGKRVFILVETIYNDLEFWYPYYRKAGLTVKADLGMADAKAGQCDGLIIPGGYAPDHMRRHPEMVKLVRDCVEFGKIVAAICHAGWMLASADVLKGRTVTSFFAIKDDMVNAGANFVDQEVVVDNNIITSRTPDDLPAFLHAIITALA
jgi:protease I